MKLKFLMLSPQMHRGVLIIQLFIVKEVTLVPLGLKADFLSHIAVSQFLEIKRG